MIDFIDIIISQLRSERDAYIDLREQRIRISVERERTAERIELIKQLIALDEGSHQEYVPRS
jgi:hypothetical protein